MAHRLAGRVWGCRRPRLISSTADADRMRKEKARCNLVSNLEGFRNYCHVPVPVPVLPSSSRSWTLPSLSPPCLLIPPQFVKDDDVYKVITKGKGKGEAVEDRDDYHHFFSVAEEKVLKISKKDKKSVRLPWQRDVLPPNQAICFGSSHGWLAYIQPRNCSLYLFNPSLPSFPYIPLPPIQTLPPFISSTSHTFPTHPYRDFNCHWPSTSSRTTLPDCRFCCRSSYSSVVTQFALRTHILPVPSQELAPNFFKRLVLSSPPNASPSCTAMALYCAGPASMETRLAFCRIGDTGWTALEEYDGSADELSDLVYSSKDQKFYTMTFGGLITAWDLDTNNPRTTIFAHLPPLHHNHLNHWSRASLVEYCSGHLLIVAEYTDLDSFHFEVFKSVGA